MPSSVIRRFSYDEPHRRLRVTFTSGDVYEYDEVPPEVNEAFRAAFSKGRFFGPNIRDRYPYRRVGKAFRTH
ncbi:KTSC domain-containing protein [Brevundimonas sp.]|uniref:KTSC domain-containing protein n=1 Tax=Brevundimonas sp. TaxID=1871086 RepID=UPI002D59867F|nr:KTSC domain-containing protein [Brevundimonas sp.]HYC99434.1 KTSC domain-containing protein [Brevundimonas sp.]